MTALKFISRLGSITMYPAIIFQDQNSCTKILNAIYFFIPLFFNARLASSLFETLINYFSKNVFFFQPNYYTFLWDSEIFLCAKMREGKISEVLHCSQNRCIIIRVLTSQIYSSKQYLNKICTHTFGYIFVCLTNACFPFSFQLYFKIVIKIKYTCLIPEELVLLHSTVASI